MQKPIIVIGGGAAGILAAGIAAQNGARVLLLEKKKRPGLKLCITGKGRCNLTNTADLPEFIAHFGINGRFLRQAFHRFFSTELLVLFASIGLPVVTERGGRVFPASGRAGDVVDVLVAWVKSFGVKISTGATVERLVSDQGQIIGVVVNNNMIAAAAVIVATGGASYPDTGSTGDGYRLATAVGHRLVPIRPALVPLTSSDPAILLLNGLQLKNINAALFVNGKKVREAFGELTFTDTGISGPVILTISGAVVDALNEGQKVELHLDLKPALDDKKLDARLLRDFQQRHQEELKNILRGLLPMAMIPVCLAMTGIPDGRLGHSVTAVERKQLRCWMKNFIIQVNGHRPLDEAIVTAGGISVREIDPRTMASKIVDGLYFAGEVLDLQADTGGFNLQAAFSTGWLAGLSAATIHADTRQSDDSTINP
ncbi:MAG: NAD(P)/FAD-dependent oxidoreductase [Desulfuromonadales bacterium]|nr:NAD(P)/FAD-dependent oxidoreductase [Desulfuromonadales bacterium]